MSRRCIALFSRQLWRQQEQSAFRSVTSVAAAVTQPSIPAASACLGRSEVTRRGFSASALACSSGGGSGGGSGDGGGSPPPAQTEAWDAATQLSAAANQLAESSFSDAVQLLTSGERTPPPHSCPTPSPYRDAPRPLPTPTPFPAPELPGLVQQYGATEPSLGLLYNQLALWHFYAGEYAAAAGAARSARDIWVRLRGKRCRRHWTAVVGLCWKSGSAVDHSTLPLLVPRFECC